LQPNDSFIFLDIEATLIRGKQHIIEIGAQKWSPNNTFESFEQLIKPSKFKKLNQHIQNLTGITTEELLKAPSFHTVIHNFIQFCGGTEGKKVIVTFGEFDRKVLEEEFSRHRLNTDFLYPIVDYQQKYMIEHQMKNQPSLNGLMESLNLENEGQHRALADANSLLKIFDATDGFQIIENQKTNEFIFLLSDMIQKEDVYEISISYISGKVENEYISINEVKTFQRDLKFDVREEERLTDEGEPAIVQIHEIHPNEEIKRLLIHLKEHLENKVLISLTGLKSISKIARLHEVSLPKTESITLKHLLKNDFEFFELKATNDLQDFEKILKQFIGKFENLILSEFKKRNLLKNEVKI